MTTPTKPLSPHLSIYKPQLTSLLSILHRATGAVLALGTFLVGYWLVAIALGPESYAVAQQLFESWLGKALLAGWSWAALYHLCNGIRHLFWDLGLGFTLKQVYWSGSAVVITSLLLTLLLWSIA